MRNVLSANTWQKRFDEKAWWKLPKELRFRWWQETQYSELEPSVELEEEVRRVLQLAVASSR